MVLHCKPPCAPTFPLTLASAECFPCGTNGSGGPNPLDLAITCPTIPSTAVVLTADTTVRVIGQNFTTGSKVWMDNVEQTTDFISTTELNFVVQPSLEPTARTATINVKDGGTTAIGTCQFSFTAAPVLTVTCPLVPATAVVSTPDIPVTVNGQLFTAASKVWMDGTTELPTVFGNANQLSFTMPMSTEAVARTAQISVRDGAVTAATICPFTITATAVVVLPIVTEIVPACVDISLPSQTVRILGQDFLPTSIVNFGGVPQATIYSSATELRVNVTTMLAHLGIHQVTVDNGGTISTPALPLTFYAVPTITNVFPDFLPTNDTALQEVTITGTNFVPTGKVFYASALEELPMTYVSATEVKAMRDPNTVGNESGSIVFSSCVNINSNNFSVQSNANPTLNLLDPTTGPVGTVVSVYAENAGAGTGAQVLVNNALVPTVMAGNIPTFTVAAGMTGTINVSVRTHVGNGDANVVAAPLTLPFVVT